MARHIDLDFSLSTIFWIIEFSSPSLPIITRESSLSSSEDDISMSDSAVVLKMERNMSADGRVDGGDASMALLSSSSLQSSSIALESTPTPLSILLATAPLLAVFVVVFV
jgi:hypothetical protein